jgi:hypothetical protein
MTDAKPLFAGEAMLLSWGDTSARGKTVTFLLHEDECGKTHPFRELGTGRHGQRFNLIAQPIGDDEQPIGSPGAPGGSAQGQSSTMNEGSLRTAEGLPVAPHAMKGDPAPGETRTYTLANRIGMRCREPAFQAWVAMREGAEPSAFDATATANYVRCYCGVESRAFIAPGTGAAALWSVLEGAFLEATGQFTEARG